MFDKNSLRTAGEGNKMMIAGICLVLFGGIITVLSYTYSEGNSTSVLWGIMAAGFIMITKGATEK